MVIKRNINGNEIEIQLTDAELSSAYYEQEHIFDMQDVRDRLNEGDPEEDYGIANVMDDMISEIAYEKRRNIDKYDMEWSEAVDDAISTILSNYKSEDD